ncbi:MAG: TetR family transcriptional regulator [Actinophytocola sp.]|uniref:TetR/AcrR family transcriptional regulator n=1 Tax=Actinophytocola sp. TaxID=1872138 RepID=UPI0013230744|nr:TetR/AcrR family transcriptional regulator [Actinophytocola sp.]MPZ84945.1 TetR family transcriptional regulator [Actinophytocola sp.]
MATAADRGREVRSRLLTAAVELIAERGWTAVSTRVLAERAGVAAGLVHYHFTSLQALLTEAAVGVMREVADSLGPLLDRAETPADALRLLMASLDGYTGSDPVSTVFSETYLAAARDPGLRDAVAGIVTDFRTRLATWLGAHGVAEPRATAAVLAAATDGILLHRALDPAMTAETVTPILNRIVAMGGTTWH